MFPREHWWAVASTDEVGRTPVKLRRFGRELVFWRDRQGHVNATDDRCPHRHASLSQGRVIGDHISCPFHAFEFDGRGRCMLAPCEGPQAEHRSQLDVRAYALHEAHGMIFLWFGDGEPQGEPPWFERITPDYHSSGFTSEWQCNYLRATEVQLDWAHLPFVHHNSIGRGFDPAIDVTHELEGDSLRTWDRRFEDEPGNPRFYLHLMFPNVWMNPVRFGMFGFLALAPIDEDRTQLYIRVYQNKVRLPVLRSAVTWLMNKVNGIITNQDQGVVEGQPSVFTPDIRDERLTASDKPIAAYRKEMRRRMRASSEGDD